MSKQRSLFGDNFTDFFNDIFGKGGLFEQSLSPDQDSVYKVIKTNHNGPKSRVWRHDGVTEVEIDVPGRQREDLNLTIEEDQIQVSVAASDGRLSRPEAKYVVRLNRNDDPNSVTAKLENGVLTIRISECDAKKTSKIQIEIE